LADLKKSKTGGIKTTGNKQSVKEGNVIPTRVEKRPGKSHAGSRSSRRPEDLMIPANESSLSQMTRLKKRTVKKPAQSSTPLYTKGKGEKEKDRGGKGCRDRRRRVKR